MRADRTGSSADARRALRRRRRRRRIRLGFVWGAVSLVALAAALGAGLGWRAGLDWIRSETHLLTVRQVDPEPTEWVPEWLIAELSGIVPGDDLLEVDVAAVAARLEAHPRIAHASVRRTWTRKIRISVVEREPLALWWRSGGELELAADGTVLGSPIAGWIERSERPRGSQLPLLTGVSEEASDPGEVLDDPGAHQALGFLALLRQYGRDGESWVSEINVANEGDLVAFTFVDATPVRIGSGRISRRKVDAIRATLSELDRRSTQAEQLDARFRNQVVVKLDPAKGR
jgi:cell division septal protein FtsQ